MQSSTVKATSDEMIHRAELYQNLYNRHLESASFLYYLRPYRLKKPNLSWTAMAADEKRFLSLINVLVQGNDKALDFCLNHRDKTKADKIHIIVRLLCRMDRPEEARRFINTIDLADEKRAMAVADPLKYDIPESWSQEFLLSLLNENPGFLPVAAETSGCRRIDISEQLLGAAATRSVDVWATVRTLRALGRIGNDNARLFLLDHLKSSLKEFLYETSLALLRVRTEQRKVYLKCKADLDNCQWPCLILSLFADENDVPLLESHLLPETKDCQCTLALGFMGHADSVSRLLQLVESETAQKNAAQALHLITGAGLYQDAGPGNEADPGKLSVDPEEWRFWWKANQYRFDTTVRYRYGRPYAPDQLVEGLEHKDSPFFVRKMAYEELVVRFGLVVPFETDLFVSQ